MVGNRPGQATYRRNREALRRRRLPCWICGQPINYDALQYDPEAFEADHETPHHAGGTDALSNLKPSHRRCNRAKSDRDHAPIVRRSGALR